ncbi:PD-(D/E)XK nuclease-like domain-containing protein [Hymenobacter terricola]|uniref:PD-(D/E)XK nuclease-like domain-containing protein n=1 Tax=Hymenobacter terricola TaxID=2819236 RepID=UPI001B306AA1|nr:PD-(D/E)XK nuclease-like domain-containing protein [Hymenobacter terricola]
MFQNLQHHPAITQAEHRALTAISNTDLSNLADELLGRPRRDCTAAFAFGSHFHTATLEPHLFEPTNAHDPADQRQRQAAAQLATAVRRRRYPRHLIYTSRGQAEQSYTATHEPTGLLVKVRPDLLIDSPKGQRRTVVDFKTTSCRDLAQFLTTVEQYGYDRQGAFYADVLQAQRVVLIAVQKKPLKGQEPQVWVVELTAGQMDSGRKKYGKLLRCAAEQHQRYQSGGQLATALVQEFGRSTLPLNNPTRHFGAA